MTTLQDFLAPHRATTLDELDERALRDLRAFLDHRVGRRQEDAAELRKPRLRGQAAAFARMVEEIDEHMQRRGFTAPPAA